MILSPNNNPEIFEKGNGATNGCYALSHVLVERTGLNYQVVVCFYSAGVVFFQGDQ